MKIYKTRVFEQWNKKEALSDLNLKKVVDEINEGLIDADLGGGLIKKRIGKPGHGKRSSYRALLAFRSQHRAIFLTAYSKNEIENISSTEKTVFKQLSAIYLNANQIEIDTLCKANKLIEVSHETE